MPRDLIQRRKNIPWGWTHGTHNDGHPVLYVDEDQFPREFIDDLNAVFTEALQHADPRANLPIQANRHGPVKFIRQSRRALAASLHNLAVDIDTGRPAQPRKRKDKPPKPEPA